MADGYEQISDEHLKELELLVWTILAQSKRARNSDTFLILKVAQSRGDDITVQRQFKDGNRKDTIIWRMDLEHLPSFESITRARRKIQAGGQFLPTDPVVCRQRRINEKRMREYYARRA